MGRSSQRVSFRHTSSGEYDTIDELQGIVVYNTMGSAVALANIAEIGFEDSPSSISKTDKQYQATISGSLNDLGDENSLNEIHEEIVKPYLSVDVKEQENTMDKYDSLKLENQLCFPLYVCAKEVVKRYKPFLDEIDLTYTQYITMMVFWEHKEMNVKELERCRRIFFLHLY